MKKSILCLLIGATVFCQHFLIAQGPVIISGLDTEYGIRPGDASHGTIPMWASVIQTGIINNVTLNPAGPILVIGGGKDVSGGPSWPPDHMSAFWNDIGTALGKTIVYSNSYSGDILTVNITGGGWSMIAICNTAAGVGILTLAELNNISSRQAEIASFVNSGGGLFASSCHIGTPPYGYINIGTPPLVSVNANGAISTPTPAGTAMGIPSIVGPFHNYFTQWPAFLSVLSTVNMPGKPNSVCILGGAGVVIPTGDNTCCKDLKNLVTNPDFSNSTPPLGFISQYTHDNGVHSTGTLLPGEYAIINSGEASTICPNWVINDHSSCPSAGGGDFMVVNGSTGQTTSKKLIWEQTINGVESWKEYKFCAYFKNLPQCCFDVKPKIDIIFSVPGYDVLNEIINASSGACDWQEISKSIYLTVGGLTNIKIQIFLDESALGDGNDLALDDIAFYLLPSVPNAQVAFGITPPTDIGGGFYNRTATAPPLPPSLGNCGVFWEIVRLDASYADIPLTKISNPPQWWPLPTYSTSIIFPGYDGMTDVLLPFNNITSLPAGKFKWDERYKITRGVFCDCFGWNQSSIIIEPMGSYLLIKDGNTKKIIRKEKKPKNR